MGHKKSHIPIRTCIICRAKKPKSELIRLVIDYTGTLAADIKGKEKGRGVYLCRNQACRENLILSKRLDSIFKVKVKSIGEIPEPEVTF